MTQPGQASPYVFLSSASVDREKALHIADLLEAHGIVVWIDRRSIAGLQFKGLFAVYSQRQLGDRPLSFRVWPPEIARLCDLTAPAVHGILKQLVQTGYREASLAPDLDGYCVTIAPARQTRE